MVAVLVMDVTIRERTDGKSSLDDLMRWMYQNFQRHEKLYTTEDVKKGLVAATGVDLSNFIVRYVEGRETIAIARSVDLGAAHWAQAFGSELSFRQEILQQSLGIQVLDESPSSP